MTNLFLHVAMVCFINKTIISATIDCRDMRFGAVLICLIMMLQKNFHEDPLMFETRELLQLNLTNEMQYC